MSFYKFIKKENEKFILSEKEFIFDDEINVMKYCYNGDFIAEVVIPKGVECQSYKDYNSSDGNNRYYAKKITLRNIRPFWNVETFKQLTDEGVDIHAGYDSVLYYAAGKGCLDVVKYLVKKDADIHTNDDCALRYAASGGHLKVVKYLVEKGANIHAQDDWALRYAACHGHLKVVRYLVDKGADNSYNLIK